MSWQPICDAPMDGTVIDVWVNSPGSPGGRITDVKWVNPFADAAPGTNTNCFMVGWKRHNYDAYTCLNADNFTHFMVVTGPDQ